MLQGKSRVVMPVARPLLRQVPGLGLAVAVAAVATALGRALPVVGAPVLAIVIGVLISAARRPAPVLRRGITVASRQVLHLSVVLLGLGLSLRQVADTGLRSLPVLACTLVVALAGGALVGRALRVPQDLRMLIGVGTGICGASAIAATAAVIDPDEADVSYAMTTIFTFNIVAVLAFPPIGHLLHLSQQAFGVWGGTAINDTSSVVAATAVYGAAAGTTGVVVKLTRTLALLPITLVLGARRRGGDPTRGTGQRWLRLVPGVVLAFAAAVVVNTLGWVRPTWHPGLAEAAALLITVALAGVGLGTRVGDLRRLGHRPLLLGGILSLGVASSSLAVQALTGLL